MGQRWHRLDSFFLYFSQQRDLQLAATLIFCRTSWEFFFFFLSFSFLLKTGSFREHKYNYFKTI